MYVRKRKREKEGEGGERKGEVEGLPEGVCVMESEGGVD